MPKTCPIRQRWSVNGRFLARNMTGVDRYALEVVKAIDGLISERHPLTVGLTLEILCPAGVVNASPFANVALRHLPSAPGHLWEQFTLPRYLGHASLLGLCNTGPVIVKKQIVCIHDANTRLVPESYGLAFRATYRVLQPALGRRIAGVVTVSHFSQKTLARLGIAPTAKIRVIHNGHEHALQWDAKRSLLSFPRPFILLVGSKALHKNVAIIYSIADELATKGIDLVVVGGTDANVYAQESGVRITPNVRHIGRVNDDDLASLYQHALCLVFPSRTEGFGLPALEAMALGCPVISSDAASLPEVCGDAALYAPPNESGAWLAAICKISAEPTLRERLANAGRKRARAFSWRRAAERYLEFMLALDDSDGKRASK
jgi:glycosyltransferase involved in cell wall biosynthesis